MDLFLDMDFLITKVFMVLQLMWGVCGNYCDLLQILTSEERRHTHGREVCRQLYLVEEYRPNICFEVSSMAEQFMPARQQPVQLIGIIVNHCHFHFPISRVEKIAACMHAKICMQGK
jgi:hypothetical protein